ncbi:MAG: BamA/TamA family outer membrane protein, partial [Gemmatimonadaceae bacterium]
SVFDRTGYRMMALDASQARGEAIPTFQDWRTTAGILPPVLALRTSVVEAHVHDPVTGLVNGSGFQERPYDPKLKLEAISPVSVGVSSSTYGTGLAGGVSVAFSDELGNRNLGASIQALGDVRDVGGEVYYMDLKHRWQRIYSIGHIPTLTGFSTVGQESVRLGGSVVDATVVNQYLRRTYFDQAQVGTTYPFSTTRRLEFSAGASRVSFNTQVQRLAVLNNIVYDLGRSDTTSPGAINFAQGAAALVFDNSVFGFTSPVAGGRSRLEFSPTLGGLTFNRVTADYRRYLFARPFTFALRTIAMGRFGKDAETNRISPLYVGDGSLVRGYSAFSFDPNECTEGVGGGATCPEFDRLVGSRIGVVNLEFRIPLFGTPELGLFSTRFLPIEISPFVDAGVAWTSDSPPKWAFERQSAERVPIVSAGVSSRFNVFGALIVEVFYAKPFQRPTKGWVWGFQLLPGW